MIHKRLLLASKNRATLKNLHGKARLQYLWDYFKLPFVLFCILIYVIAYLLYGHFTKKENVLYIAYTNVSVGDTLSESLLDDYLSYRNLSTKKNRIYTYTNLYITNDPVNDDYQYAYASSTKLLAAIDSKHLDLILMNEEALNALVQQGYLSDLTQFIPESIENAAASAYALNASHTELFKNAGFSDNVYIGVIDNSPRKEEALRYLEYFFTQS